MGDGIERWGNYDPYIKTGGEIMIYDNPGERLQDIKDYVVGERKTYRMATVMSISNGRPYVRFYGEGTASQKPYKYISSYAPSIGDKVLLIRAGASYVIMGKVV